MVWEISSRNAERRGKRFTEDSCLSPSVCRLWLSLNRPSYPYILGYKRKRKETDNIFIGQRCCLHLLYNTCPHFWYHSNLYLTPPLPDGAGMWYKVDLMCGLTLETWLPKCGSKYCSYSFSILLLGCLEINKAFTPLRWRSKCCLRVTSGSEPSE